MMNYLEKTVAIFFLGMKVTMCTMAEVEMTFLTAEKARKTLQTTRVDSLSTLLPSTSRAFLLLKTSFRGVTEKTFL